MTKRSRLRSLPPELLQHIIGEYVALVPLAQAWSSRETCSAYKPRNASIRPEDTYKVTESFYDTIMYEIVHHVPLSYLSNASMSETSRQLGGAILRRNLTAILECSARERLELENNKRIDERLALVLEYTASTENTLLKVQYTKDLVRQMMVTEAAITLDDLLAYPFSWGPEVLSQFGILVATTAVDDVAATAKFFTTFNTRQWIQYHYVFSSGYIQSICPLAAAASTGKSRSCSTCLCFSRTSMPASFQNFLYRLSFEFSEQSRLPSVPNMST
jgi:hypothetical protein